MTITADTTDADRAERIAAALADPDHLFTSAQVADLMATAARWGRESADWESPGWRAGFDAGYRARVAEENQAYPPPPVFSMGQWWDQAENRRRCDRDARRRWRTDHRGGPVKPW
jgi:hypothetical protein